ncbi:unnamed protein product [Dicrocoelium dendriticum]|nr:unnamed protein product [Dicrocoelium dendriticum]
MSVKSPSSGGIIIGIRGGAIYLNCKKDNLTAVHVLENGTAVPMSVQETGEYQRTLSRPTSWKVLRPSVFVAPIKQIPYQYEIRVQFAQDFKVMVWFQSVNQQTSDAKCSDMQVLVFASAAIPYLALVEGGSTKRICGRTVPNESIFSDSSQVTIILRSTTVAMSVEKEEWGFDIVMVPYKSGKPLLSSCFQAIFDRPISSTLCCLSV